MIADVVCAVKATRELVNAVPFLEGSGSEDGYREVLELVEYLTKEDDTNPLIDLLTSRTAEYENNNEKFAEFDKTVTAVPVDVALLRTLIDQHNLTYADLKSEIDSKPPVSQTSSGQRSLTIPHIKVPSARLGVKSEWFLRLIVDAKSPDALRLPSFERAQILNFTRPCLSFRLLSLLLLIYQ